MNTRNSLPLLLACALIGCGKEDRPSGREDLATDRQKLGYVIGIDIGTRLKNQPHPIDIAAVLAGIEDKYLDRATRVRADSILALQKGFQKKSDDYEKAMQERRQKALAFLEENKKREDVVALADDLQYTVLHGAAGEERPGERDSVRLHLKGTLLDGTVLEDTRAGEGPRTLALSQALEGMRRVVKTMSPGMKIKAWIPPQLAYGRLRKGDAIPEYALLVYEIELLDIRPAAPGDSAPTGALSSR